MKEYKLIRSDVHSDFETDVNNHLSDDWNIFKIESFPETQTWGTLVVTYAHLIREKPYHRPNIIPER